MAADFKEGTWNTKIDVRDFIQKNYTPYTGDESFLAGPTERTVRLKTKLDALLAEERERGGVLDVETQTVSSLLNYAPGYLDREDELIVGLQTDAPLRRVSILSAASKWREKPVQRMDIHYRIK